MKPVSINSRKFLGSYIDAREYELFSDGLALGGLLLWLALQAIYCFLGGTIALVTFAATTLAGLTLGLAMNREQAAQVTTSITGAMPRTPSVTDDKTKKAA